jgi:hypothetical protein
MIISLNSIPILLNSRVGAKTRTRGARPRVNLNDVSF